MLFHNDFDTNSFEDYSEYKEIYCLVDLTKKSILGKFGAFGGQSIAALQTCSNSRIPYRKIIWFYDCY